MSGSFLIEVRQLSGSRQVVIWNSLGRLMSIITESSASHFKSCYQEVIRKSFSTKQRVMRQSLPSLTSDCQAAFRHSNCYSDVKYLKPYHPVTS